MEITWLADTPQSRNRVRAPKACADCQRRKKRCRHFLPYPQLGSNERARGVRGQDQARKSVSGHEIGADGSANDQIQDDIRPRPSTCSRSASTGRTISPTVSTSISASVSPSSPMERFVGDLNPEAVIRERLDESTPNSLRDRVGVWINPGDREESTRTASSHVHTSLNLNTLHPEVSAQQDSTITATLVQQYTCALQACSRLPLSTVEPLTALFMSKINPIIPLLDPSSVSFSSSSTKSSPLHSNSNINTNHISHLSPATRPSPLLERAICLVAAKDASAHPHLHLTTTTSPPLSTRHFCTKLYKGLVSAMHAGLEPDRYTRIRILALMSLHCEGYEGAESASLHLCEAIHQAQTAGLHLARPGRNAHDASSLLFWALWTLDKMNACLGGRAVMLADRDIGLERPWRNWWGGSGEDASSMQSQSQHRSPGQSQSQGRNGPSRSLRCDRHLEPFRVWFGISELLDTVISFYRPGAGESSGWEDGFPAFEDIVGETRPGDLDYNTLSFLELYYHSVAILSRRHKPREPLDNSKHSSIRQGLSALRIHSLLTSSQTLTQTLTKPSTSTSEPHSRHSLSNTTTAKSTRSASTSTSTSTSKRLTNPNLPALPLIPYSISLALGVSYRQVRSSKLITYLDRAKASLAANCALLEDLSEQWYAAEAMARLGRKALVQIGDGGGIDARGRWTGTRSRARSRSPRDQELGYRQSVTARVSLAPVPVPVPGPVTMATKIPGEHDILLQGMAAAAAATGENGGSLLTTSTPNHNQSQNHDLPLPLSPRSLSYPHQHLQHEQQQQQQQEQQQQLEPDPAASATADTATTDPINHFTDIDMIFGEFLDLSMPTNFNFWDPIFATDGDGDGDGDDLLDG